MGSLDPSKADPGSVAVLTMVEVTWPPAPMICALGLLTPEVEFPRVALQARSLPTFKDFLQGNPRICGAILVEDATACLKEALTSAYTPAFPKQCR